MSADDFAKWLQARLEGSPNTGALAEWTDTATELVNGELRPAVVCGFPSGDVFVLAIGKAAA